MAQKSKQKSGGAKLAESGRKPILVALTLDEHARIREAANHDRRSMTQFVASAALTAAEKILGKIAI